jgi:aminoglycoside phosphotransferase (APT) family kinase protein
MKPLPTSVPDWAAHLEGVAYRGPARVLGVSEAGPNVVAVHARADPTQWVVAKHYRDDSGSGAAAAMTALREALAQLDDPPLAVPRVLDWNKRRRVLLQSLAPGRPLLPELQSARRRFALRAAGRALACLHRTPVQVGRVTGMTEHLTELVRPHPDVLALDLPAIGARVRAVTATLTAGSRPAEAARPVAIHRDAHPRQMFLDGPRLWVVDWDLYARGDAALDVANFAVYLRTHLEQGAAAAEIFVEAYLGAGTDVTARLPRFIALTYVRLIAKSARLRRPDWQERIRVYLDRAERALSA